MSKEVDEYFTSPEIEKLRDEMRKADANRKTLETKILSLQTQSGEALLTHGSKSSEFQRIAKELKKTKEELDDASILNVALREGIKLAEKQQRQRISARILKENKEIIEKYSKTLPQCPRCKSSDHVSLVEVIPDSYKWEANTQPIEAIWFQCDYCGPAGIRFSIVRSEMEGLVGKIEEAAKKAASVVASLL